MQVLAYKCAVFVVKKHFSRHNNYKETHKMPINTTFYSFFADFINVVYFRLTFWVVSMAWPYRDKNRIVSLAFSSVNVEICSVTINAHFTLLKIKFTWPFGILTR